MSLLAGVLDGGEGFVLERGSVVGYAQTPPRRSVSVKDIYLYADDGVVTSSFLITIDGRLFDMNGVVPLDQLRQGRIEAGRGVVLEVKPPVLAELNVWLDQMETAGFRR